MNPKSHCKVYKQAAVRQQYAQHLFEQGNYQKACEQFIQTIGSLEPSVVVRAFLEFGRTVELAQYLEELHKNKQAAPSHTNLLMNCYTKNDDMAGLVRFVREAEESFARNQHDV